MNRKHLRSLAAVQRGKKNARSLEVTHFGVGNSEGRQVPIRTLEDQHADFHMHNTRLTFDSRRVAGVNAGDELNDFDVLGLGDLNSADPSVVLGELLAARREELVNSTPEQFFWRLQRDVSAMMDQVIIPIRYSHPAANEDELANLMVARRKLSSQARDIVIFMMRARGMELHVVGDMPVDPVDLSGFPRTDGDDLVDFIKENVAKEPFHRVGISRKMRTPDWVVSLEGNIPDGRELLQKAAVFEDSDTWTPEEQKALLAAVDINIEDTYPKTQTVPLEVAAEMAVKHKPFVDDIHNNDVAKTYPKSDCLPVGFADEVIAKEKPVYGKAVEAADKAAREVFRKRRQSLGDESGHYGNNMEPGDMSEALTRRDEDK